MSRYVESRVYVSHPVQARTARKLWRCDQGRCAIRPGHRYLRHVFFPGSEECTGPAPSVFLECVAHAAYAENPSAGTGACETYCCAVDPCARPFGHDGDHSCRRCPEENP